MKKALPPGVVIAAIVLAVIAVAGAAWIVLGSQAPRNEAEAGTITPVLPGKKASSEETSVLPSQKPQNPTPDQADDETHKDEEPGEGE